MTTWNAGVVGVAAVDRAEEVGDAQVPIVALTREGEPEPLGAAVVARPHHEIVAVGVDGEVAPHDGRHQPPVGLGLVELGAQRGADALLELGVGLAERLVGPELPLVAEQRGLVDVARDLVERDALWRRVTRGRAA